MLVHHRVFFPQEEPAPCCLSIYFAGNYSYTRALRKSSMTIVSSVMAIVSSVPKNTAHWAWVCIEPRPSKLTTRSACLRQRSKWILVLRTFFPFLREKPWELYWVYWRRAVSLLDAKTLHLFVNGLNPGVSVVRIV